MNKRTVHIALVGGQPMPVYVGIKATEPEFVWLIHSKGEKGSEPEADIIMQQCGIPSKKMEFPAVDYSIIIERAMGILERLKDHKVVINISSGTKPWAVAFSLLSVNRENVSLIYVDQNNRVYDITNKEFLSFSLETDILTILKFNHKTVSAFTDITDYTQEDENTLKEIQQIRRFNYRDFNELTIPLDKSRQNSIKQNQDLFFTTESGSSIAYDSKAFRIEILLNKRKGYIMIDKAETLISPHVKDIVFFSGWFEYKVANLLKDWRYQRGIWLNVKFPYYSGAPKNEIDVIVNANNKLLFIECKTQIFDITDIDKFRSAVKNYGGMSSKALFITDTATMKPEAQQKCEDNGVLTFCMGTGCSEKQCKETLFALLEKDMLNINKR